MNHFIAFPSEIDYLTAQRVLIGIYSVSWNENNRIVYFSSAADKEQAKNLLNFGGVKMVN